MTALELGEHLRVGVEMAKGEAPSPIDEKAPVAPPARKRNEIRRRGELYVDRQLLLQPRNRAQRLVLLRIESDIDMDRRRAPAEQDRGSPASQ